MATLPPRYAYVAATDAPETIKQALKMYGTAEVPGNSNNSIILAWAGEVERATDLPHLGYTNDAIPWCGLFASLVCVRAGYADQVAAVKSVLWAPSWINFGNPSPIPGFGDIMVFSRNGGGHVSFYVGEDADCYHILGGNQSDMVDIMREPKSKFTGARRPKWGVGGQPVSVRKIIVGPGGAAPATAPASKSVDDPNAHTSSASYPDGSDERKWTLWCQQWLNDHAAAGIAVDGDFGPMSRKAIADFFAIHADP